MVRADEPFPVGDRDVLLLSPHLDDAWLSAAALIGATECEIWTVFGGAPDPAQQTAWDIASGFADSDATMAARTAEDRAAFSDMESRVRRLPYLEASYAEPPLRREQSAALRADMQEWAEQRPGGVLALPVCAGVHVEPATWQKARERLRQSDVGAPPQSAGTDSPAAASAAAPSSASASPESRRAAASLVRRAMHADHQRRRRKAQRRGMAANPDHVLVRDVGLEVAAAVPGVEVLLWEDLPYLWHERGAARIARLERSYGLDATRIDVEVDVAQKYRRLSNYASQLEVLDPQHKRLTDRAGLPATETYWMMRRRA